MDRSVARAVGILYEEVENQYDIGFTTIFFVGYNVITSLRRINQTCDNVIMEIRVTCRSS